MFAYGERYFNFVKVMYAGASDVLLVQNDIFLRHKKFSDAVAPMYENMKV